MASSQVWLRNFIPKEEKQITLLKKPKVGEDSPPSGDPLDHLSQKNNQIAPMKIQKIEKRPSEPTEHTPKDSSSKDASRGKGNTPPTAVDPARAKITGVMKPMRTGTGSETSSPEPPHVNRAKTLEEREEEYAKARARIFKDHPPGSDSDDASPDQDNDHKKPSDTKKSSSSDDLEVLDSEFKPQDKTHPDEFDKESDVGNPQWNQLFGFHDQMALFSGGPTDSSMFSNGPSMHATRSKNSTDRQAATTTTDRPGGTTSGGQPSPANGSPRTGGLAGSASPQNDRAQQKREQQDRSPTQQQPGYPIHLRVLQQGGYPMHPSSGHPHPNPGGGGHPHPGGPNSQKNPPSPTQNRTQHNNYRGSKTPNLSPNQPHVMNPNHMGGPPPHHMPPGSHMGVPLSPYHYQRPLQINPQYMPQGARGHPGPPRGGDPHGGPGGGFDPNSVKFQPPNPKGGDGFHETPYERFDPHEQFVPYSYTNPGPYGRESPFPGHPFSGNSPFIPSPYPGYPHPYPHDKSMTPIFQQNPPTNFPSGGPPNSRGDHSGGDPSKGGGPKRASHGGPPLQQYQPFPPAGPGGPGGAMHYPQHVGPPISSNPHHPGASPLRMSPYLKDNETSEVSDLMKTNLFIASPPRILSNWNGTQ